MVTRPHLEQLVVKARAGDREAFSQIVEGEREHLASFIHGRIGDRLKAHLDLEDVFQETLMRAFESIAGFQWRGQHSVYNWLCTIAQHVMLEAARSERARRKLQLYSDPPESAASPSKILRRNERFDRLEKAIGELSPEHREVIVLSRIERHKIDEIARKLNRSPDAVKQLLSRALKKLKESFGDTESLHLPERSLQQGGIEHVEGE